MKTINVSDATNTQLDWLVAKCEGVTANQWEFQCALDGTYEYTTSGDLMVPIIERERISIRFWSNTERVHAYMPERDAEWAEGPTALIAAARCYIESKLGRTVEVPEMLK